MSRLSYRAVFLSVVCVLMLAFASHAVAATVVVNSVGDAADPDPADGICGSPFGCTLRAAIQTANAIAGADTILLPAGTYTLAIGGQGEENSATGDLDVRDDVTIIGAGGNPGGNAAATIIEAGTSSALAVDRVLDVKMGAGGNGLNVTLQALTIRHGSAQFDGGGISYTSGDGSGSLVLSNVVVERNTAASSAGLLLHNNSSTQAVRVTIDKCVIHDNDSASHAGGIRAHRIALTIRDSRVSLNIARASSGGAIQLVGPGSLTVERSLFNENEALGSGFGGAIYSDTFTPTDISDSTFSGNRAGGSGGAIAFGSQGTALNLRNVTMTGNVAVNGAGGGIHRFNAPGITLTNSIVYGNSSLGAAEISGFVISTSSYNIIGANGDGGLFDGTNGNRIGVDPLLSPLGDFGGPTQTHALLRGSPAIEAGTNSGVSSQDQRGFPRTLDSADRGTLATADIGAYEAYPTLESIADQTTVAGNTFGVSFNVGDDSVGGGVTVTATSSNQTVMPDGNFSVSGSTGSRTLAMRPMAAGTAVVTVRASALGRSDTTTFTLTATQPPQYATTTSISAPAITYGSDAAITVTVSSLGGTPSGNVSLTIDGAATFTQAIANGVTTFMVPNLSAGTHTLSATYEGVLYYRASSATSSITVNKSPSFFAITAPDIRYGQAAIVTVTATAGTPTGNITLNVMTPQTQPLVNGVATFSIPSLDAMVYAMEATYAGDSNFEAGYVPGVLLVRPADTFVGYSLPSVAYGDPATVTITVHCRTAVPPGSVVLSVDGVSQSYPLTNGVATVTLPTLEAGTHMLLARYAASQNFNGSSTSTVLLISRAPSSVVIDAPPITYGSDATIRVLASSSAGAPAGDVTLNVDGSPYSAVLDTGVATFTISGLYGGSHTLVATYEGNNNFLPSTTSSTLQVSRAATTVAASAPTGTYGELLPVTIIVTSAAGTPEGEVALVLPPDGATVTTTLANGTGTISILGTEAGTRTLTVQYDGDGNFAPATTTIDVVVNKATPSFFWEQVETATYPQPFILRAGVPGPWIPTGTVEYTILGQSVVGTLFDGVAGAISPELPAGTHTIYASYGGDANFNATTFTGSITVLPATTTTAISAPPIAHGSNANITITVSSRLSTPPGDVTLTIDGGAPQTYALVNGVATAVIPMLPGGEHAVAATYAATENHSGSSATSILVVTQAPTSLSIVAPPVVYGGTATITVSTTYNGAAPTGDVTLTVNGSTVAAPFTAGVATFTIPAPPAGDHAIVADYPGDANYMAAAGTSTLHVDRAPVALSYAAPSVTYGSGDPTLTIIATSPGGRATGNITLTPSGGGTPLTQPLIDGAATFVFPGLGAGTYWFTADYAGDANFLPNSSPATFTVNQAMPEFSVSSPFVYYGNDATITVTSISPAVPTGTITLNLDGVPQVQPLIGGVATFVWPGLGVGTHGFSAWYAGDSNFIDVGAPFNYGSVSVVKLQTQIAVDTPPVVYGQDAVVTLTFTSAAGTPDGSVRLSVDGGVPQTQPIVSGVATFTIPGLTTGFHLMNVTYDGTPYYTAASFGRYFTVSPTTTVLTISAPAISFGDDATITVTASSAGVAPTGEVSLSMYGPMVWAPFVNGVATFVVPGLDGGDHAFELWYLGDRNYAEAVASGSVHVEPAAVTLTPTAPPIVYGNDATITITATSAIGTPVGRITLTHVSSGATMTALLSAGAATFAVPALDAGDHEFTASLAANVNVGSSFTSFTQHVDPATSTLAIDAPSIVYGNDAAVTVTASSDAGVPAGDVTLTVDGGAPSTQPLVSGVATFTLSSLGGGDYALAATYGGSANILTSSATATLRVEPAASTVSIDAPSIVFGDSATIAITAASAAGVPDGDVTLAIDGGASFTQPLVAGVATFVVPSLRGGDHPLVASYAGNANFATATATSTLTVTRAATTIAIASITPSPSFAGDGVTVAFTASAPSGDVTISSGLLSCVTTVAAGDCTLTFPAGGTFDVIATFAGDTDYAPSTSAAFPHNVEWPIGHAIVSGDAVVCDGSTATISVTLTGTAPWTLTWSDGVVETTSSATHQRAVRVDDDAVYSLTSASDAHREMTIEGGASFAVRDVDAPSISGPDSAAIGASFTLTATRGYDSYEWYHDGRLMAGATSRTLKIEAVAVADFGSYSVVGFVGRCVSPRSRSFDVAETESEPELETLVATIVGATDGANGARFRSAMHLFNAGDESLDAALSFVPAGAGGGSAATTLSLLPRETRWYGDVFGGSGLASADLTIARGATPLGLVHVYNDAGEQGTTGLLQPLVDAGRTQRAGDRAVLIAPADPVATRLNVGVRSLGRGAVIRFTVRDASGTTRTAFDREYPASYFTHVSATQFFGIEPGPNDAIEIEIVDGSAIVYGASTDNITNDPNIQFAQRIGSGSDARRLLAVVGSTPGAFGSRFRTGVQLHNASDEVRSATFTFQPGTVSKSFAIDPHGTLAIDDLLPALGLEGLGTADLVTSSSVIAVIRVFNDGEGETSMTEEAVEEANVLDAGNVATLLAPHDPSNARFNIGIRTLEEGATLVATVRSPQGVVVASRELTLGPTHFQHTSATDATGHAFTGDESVTWEVKSGRALIYGVWTDNRTNDPSFHYAQ